MKWFQEIRYATDVHPPGSPEWWEEIDGDRVRTTLSGIFRHVERLIPEARARVYHELASLYCDYCGRDHAACFAEPCAGYPEDAPPAWVARLAQTVRDSTPRAGARAIYEALGHPEHQPNDPQAVEIPGPHGEPRT